MSSPELPARPRARKRRRRWLWIPITLIVATVVAALALEFALVQFDKAALLEREGLDLDPDMVLLIYVVNDIDSTRLLVERLLDLPDPRAAPPQTLGDQALGLVATWLPATLHLLAMASLRMSGGERQADAVTDLDAMPAWRDGWQRSRTSLLRIRDLCRERALPLHVLDYSYPRIAELRVACESEGIRCHAFQFTSEESQQDIANSFIDAHPNARGHEILCEKLLSFDLVP